MLGGMLPPCGGLLAAFVGFQEPRCKKDCNIDAGCQGACCPLAGCQGSMSRQFSSHDLYTQLSYLRYLFDHERQRDNLQRKRTCPC